MDNLVTTKLFSLRTLAVFFAIQATVRMPEAELHFRSKFVLAGVTGMMHGWTLIGGASRGVSAGKIFCLNRSCEWPAICASNFGSYSEMGAC